jgi:hypothetical protein
MPRGALLALASAVALVAAGCGGGSGTRPEIALLTRVDAGSDRVTFTFESPAEVEPRWAGADDLREDGSGRLVHVEGGAFLGLRFEGATGCDTTVDEGRMTYHGPRRIAVPGDGTVRDVVRLGDFEAVLTWAIGLDGQRLYSLDRDGDRVILRFS